MKEISILTIVGARPQFIKAAVISRAIVQFNESSTAARIREELLHTGQHYDDNMSRDFFVELGIPEPAINLGVGSGLHGDITGRMLAGIEAEIISRAPDLLLVYGDTNSTLAGALAAAKLHVPVAHVEAGLRSDNRRMPEEINRVVTDQLSSLLFCPTPLAVENLRKEGITEGIHHTGDVMYDAVRIFGRDAEETTGVLTRLGLSRGGYCLATVHRAENTDSKSRLSAILEALAQLNTEIPVVIPLHPRTRKSVKKYDLGHQLEKLKATEPVPYLEMTSLEKNSRVIITDSGGIQKEAYFHGVPCVTLREETEWIETVEHGWNQLTGADPAKIIRAARKATTGSKINAYGDGRAAQKIIKVLTRTFAEMYAGTAVDS